MAWIPVFSLFQGDAPRATVNRTFSDHHGRKDVVRKCVAEPSASANDKPSPSAWSLDLALEQTSIGRQIKENLSEEQLKQVKEMKGFPGLGDNSNRKQRK